MMMTLRIQLFLTCIVLSACSTPGAAPARSAPAAVKPARAGPKPTSRAVDPKLLLPRDTLLRAVDRTRTASDARSLFAAINGGAELYIGLGFRRAVFQTYELQPGRRANLEIYQMKDAAAARALYRQKSGNDGQPVKVAQEALFKGYYLLFLRGPYFVSVTGHDVQNSTLAGLLPLARAVDARLANAGSR